MSFNTGILILFDNHFGNSMDCIFCIYGSVNPSPSAFVPVPPGSRNGGVGFCPEVVRPIPPLQPSLLGYPKTPTMSSKHFIRFVSYFCFAFPVLLGLSFNALPCICIWKMQKTPLKLVHYLNSLDLLFIMKHYYLLYIKPKQLMHILKSSIQKFSSEDHKQCFLHQIFQDFFESRKHMVKFLCTY